MLPAILCSFGTSIVLEDVVPHIVSCDERFLQSPLHYVSVTNSVSTCVSVSATTHTVADVLASVDTCPALTKTVEDSPSPPTHCVSLVLDVVVDDVEVCVSSRTMKNTVWSHPRASDGYKEVILLCVEEKAMKGQKKLGLSFGFGNRN